MKRPRTTRAENILKGHMPGHEGISLESEGDRERDIKRNILSAFMLLFPVRAREYELEVEIDAGLPERYIDLMMQTNDTRRGVIRTVEPGGPHEVVTSLHIDRSKDISLAVTLDEQFSGKDTYIPETLDLMRAMYTQMSAEELRERYPNKTLLYFPGTVILLDQYYVPYLDISGDRVKTGIYHINSGDGPLYRSARAIYRVSQ